MKKLTHLKIVCGLMYSALYIVMGNALSPSNSLLIEVINSGVFAVALYLSIFTTLKVIQTNKHNEVMPLRWKN